MRNPTWTHQLTPADGARIYLLVQNFNSLSHHKVGIDSVIRDINSREGSTQEMEVSRFELEKTRPDRQLFRHQIVRVANQIQQVHSNPSA